MPEGEGWKTVEEQALEPEWPKAGRVHDWRNYIGKETRAIWNTFTDAQKVALALDADDRAGYENWD